MKSPAITVESLLVLDAIADRGSYALAAEQLNKVPSALSYIVQKLEEQLDVTIFQREGRRSVLTPAGKHLLAEGRNILLAINKISEQTKEIAHGWEPKIRIALDSIIDSSQVFTVLAKFLSQFPNVEIDICEHVLHGTWEALIEDKIDLAIGASSPIPVQKGLRAHKLAELQLIFCVNANHPLAHTTSGVTKKALANYRTIVVHDSSKVAVPWTTSGVIAQSERLYVASIDQKINAIKAGVGGGFLPKKRVQTLLNSGELVRVNVVDFVEKNELFLSWKTVNQGKGLQQLIEQLIASTLADSI